MFKDSSATSTLTLSGNNTYSGITRIWAGTLRAGSTTGLSKHSSLTLISGGIVDLGGFSNGVAGFDGIGGTVTNDRGAGALFSFGTNANSAFQGTLTDGSGTLAINKTGTATIGLYGANTYTGTTTVSAGTLTMFGNWNTGTSTANVSVSSGATLSGAGTITAPSFASIGINSGVISLTGANKVGTLSASGTVASLGAVNISTTGAGNDLTLSSGTALSSAATGDAIMLATACNFINNRGASALGTPSGRWLVYAQSSAGIAFNGLNSGNTAVWNTAAGSSVSATGNRYVFAEHPIVTVTSTARSKTYGADATAVIASSYAITGIRPGVSGPYLGDSLATVLSGTSTVSSAGSAATAAAGDYVITVGAGTLSALSGYGLALASTGVLTVNKAPIVATVVDESKTYDGLAYGGGNGVSYDGLVNRETASALGGTVVYGGESRGAVNAGDYELAFRASRPAIMTSAIVRAAWRWAGRHCSSRPTVPPKPMMDVPIAAAMGSSTPASWQVTPRMCWRAAWFMSAARRVRPTPASSASQQPVLLPAIMIFAT